MHLQRVLEIRFPIFIMVTKADRILGFSEFFSKLDPVDQRQLVGWSNPQGPDKPYALATFDEAYEEILTRIHKLRMKFTANEEIVQNVDRIFVFPEELRALARLAEALLPGDLPGDALRRPVRLPRLLLLLRRPAGQADRAGDARAARQLGRGDRREPRADLQALPRLLHQGLLREEGLPRAGAHRADEGGDRRRRRRPSGSSGASSVFIVLLVLGGMIPAFIGLKRIVEPIKRNVAAAQECVEKEPCSHPEGLRHLARHLQEPGRDPEAPVHLRDVLPRGRLRRALGPPREDQPEALHLHGSRTPS